MPLYLGAKIPMDPKFCLVSPKFCGEFESALRSGIRSPERRVIGGEVLTNTG